MAMDIFVLDQNFNTIYLIDAYKSIIWTDRYWEAGEFELYTEVSGEVLNYVTKDCYLTIKDSEHTMIVTDIDITSDLELGNHIQITGHSLEQILDRRIVWGFKEVNTTLQNGIKALINESIISPSDSNRKIPNFIFQESTDPKVTGINLSMQFTGDNLYTVISNLCYEYDLGFKIILNDQNQFVFSLYAGKDRSYDQTENPYVMFSNKFENLVNSDYHESNAGLKNVTLVGGQGEGSDRVYTSVGSGSGLNRRELFTDARDLSPDDISSAQYVANLQARGKQKLDETQETVSFEGQVEPYNSFVYRKDYDLGDIVQIENEYGKTGTTRITEVVACTNEEDGYKIYPTFENIGANG